MHFFFVLSREGTIGASRQETLETDDHVREDRGREGYFSGCGENLDVLYIIIIAMIAQEKS